MKRVYASLEIDGEEIHRCTGEDSETLRYVVWNTTRHKGKTAKITLVDQSRNWRLLFDMLFEAHLKIPPPDQEETEE